MNLRSTLSKKSHDKVCLRVQGGANSENLMNAGTVRNKITMMQVEFKHIKWIIRRAATNMYDTAQNLRY